MKRKYYIKKLLNKEIIIFKKGFETLMLQIYDFCAYPILELARPS